MPSPKDAGTIGSAWLTAGLTAILWFAHQLTGWWLGLELFRQAGGVTRVGRLTYYGGIDHAWTNLAWLPAGLPLAAGGGFVGLGLLLVLLGSGAAAYTAATALLSLASPMRPRFGRWAWRLWVSLSLWSVWVPVPVRMTWTYWHTVAY